ncbi:NUDIX domain-containing protein [Bradyrhizobium genosp. L]|nr:NUDIX hydrolase [Bradyrhizobium genosp. L]QPF83320.1 NUDIX domain-containing protein [Bradyrhizobium genosp. L]
MARTPVLAAGGIVLRRETPPRFAVVRLRKRNEWVLPKGKLDDGETPRAAAEREVLEETGHAVEVHEFLGTLVYESGGRFKAVHYWRMDAGGKPVRELMNDIREVDWLPLEAALERLSRGYERAFLENVGPIALQAAAAAESERRARLRAAAAERRKLRQAAEAPTVETPVVDPPDTADVPMVAETPPAVAQPTALEASQAPLVIEMPVVEVTPVAETPAEIADEADVQATAPQDVASDDTASETDQAVAAEQTVEAAVLAEAPTFEHEIEPGGALPQTIVRKNLLARVRDWLRRAA